MVVYIRASFKKEAGIESNSGRVRTHLGGPKLIFRDKEIPALVIPNPTVSITSKILADIPKRLDELV